jgi:hypothetical protein
LVPEPYKNTILLCKKALRHSSFQFNLPPPSLSLRAEERVHHRRFSVEPSLSPVFSPIKWYVHIKSSL